MRYEIIHEINVAKVLRHFIRIEATRLKYADKREKMISWTCLPDTAFIREVHNFAQMRDDENPTIGWTIGTKINKHYLKVRRWFWRTSTSTVYTLVVSIPR
jgi:hypothetical protein